MKIDPLERSDITFFAGLSSLLYSILDRFHIILPLCIAFSISFFIIGLVFVHSYRVYRLDEKRFEVFNDSNGEGYLFDVKNATRFIVATNFTDGIPSKKYLDALNSRMQEGVHLLRVIPENTDIEATKSEWLKSFQGQERYSEMRVKVKLPFDIFIFDREIITFAFPEDKLNRQFVKGIRIKNKEVALWFRNMIDNLQEL